MLESLDHRKTQKFRTDPLSHREGPRAWASAARLALGSCEVAGVVWALAGCALQRPQLVGLDFDPEGLKGKGRQVNGKPQTTMNKVAARAAVKARNQRLLLAWNGKARESEGQIKIHRSAGAPANTKRR